MQTVRTIYAAHLSTCKALGRPHTLLPNSTLNQKFNLFKDDVPNINQYPIVGYVGIGNKGATYDITSDNFVLTSPVPHLPRDAALYNHIPFVVRHINDDLPAEERIKFRMRVPVTVAGEPHVAYYLRALSLEDVIPTVELRNVQESNITTDTFTPTIGDLSPNHPAVSNINVNNPSGDYLVSSAKVNLILNRDDVTNIRDACELMFGDPRYAVINEIALVSAVDKIQQGTFGSVTSNYMDVIAAQVNAFIYQYHALTESTTEVQLRFDIGSSEMLLL